MKDLKNKLRKYGIPILLCISLICNIFSIQQVVEFNNQVIELNDIYDALDKENHNNLDLIEEYRNDQIKILNEREHYEKANESLHKSIDELNEEIETIKSENEEKSILKMKKLQISIRKFKNTKRN